MYRLYHRWSKCVCGHSWLVDLTGQAYRLERDRDNVYWYAVGGQNCPNCGEQVYSVTQKIAELKKFCLFDFQRTNVFGAAESKRERF
jgi:hypothetical protein